MASAEFTDFFFLKNAVILCGTNNLQQDPPEDIVDGIIEIGHCLKKRHYHINIFICVLLPRDECTFINRVYVIETNKILKVKCSLNKFFFIDQDTYWTQPNGCLNSHMFYLDKLHLVEKGNIVLAKFICRLMEYSCRIITGNKFKTSYKLENVSKSILSVSAVSFIPAPTLTVNPVMSLHGRKVLISVNTTCRVRNVSLYSL